MKRKTTCKINFILDNILPPIIRDSKLFMALGMRLVLGEKYKSYMEFKEKLPYMDEMQINAYYELLGDTFIQRETDLNEKCVEHILDNIKEGSVLDAAAGRCYLANKIADKLGRCSAMDIITPNANLQKIDWINGSLTDIPYEEDTFDIVICTHALEHIKDVDKAVQELRRICKKKLIIVLPRQREYKYTFDLHINFYPYKYNVVELLGNNIHIELVDGDWFCVENFE